MGNLPVLKPKEVIHSLEKLGFVEVRQRGSHKQFRHLDGRATTVPVHSGKDITNTFKTDSQGYRYHCRNIPKV